MFDILEHLRAHPLTSSGCLVLYGCGIVVGSILVELGKDLYKKLQKK